MAGAIFRWLERIDPSPLWFMRRLEKFLYPSRKTHDIQTRAIIRLIDKGDPEGARRFNDELDRLNGGDDRV